MKLQKGFYQGAVDQLLCKALLVFSVGLLTNVAAQAQQANKWILGNQVELNFSSGSPVAVPFTSTPYLTPKRARLQSRT